ncbi:MAG TPA: ThuA domain-containing protein [Acidimicrobiales bacterium]|nr:ThuA domain-containing protein [Acidimicrobiales bacterium]
MGMVRALLVTSRGNLAPGHPYRGWVHGFYPEVVKDALAGAADLAVTGSTEALSADVLSHFDVVVNNSLFLEPTTEQFDALFSFVEAGGGFMALHTGLVSFLNDARYEQMLGARFIGHAPIKAFQVDPNDVWYGWGVDGSPKHPISDGMATFGTLDELYVEQVNTAELSVVARAELLPVMWVRSFGSGRVACLTLGHDAAAMAVPGFRHLLTNGVLWAASRQPVAPRSWPTGGELTQEQVGSVEVAHSDRDLVNLLTAARRGQGPATKRK